MAKRRWGSGEVHPPGDLCGTWSVRWREDGRKRFKAGFDSGVQARQWLDRKRVELAARRGAGVMDEKRAETLSWHADAWLERRRFTHSSHGDDRSRWTVHLRPVLGSLKPSQLDTATIRAFVEGSLKARTSKPVIKRCIALLSTLYSDLAERPAETGVTLNPVRGLPKSLRRLYKHQPAPRQYVRKAAEVRSIFLRLPPPVAVAYALGALGGMRTGEILALDWRDVSVDGTGRIEVHQAVTDGRIGPTKDRERRTLSGDGCGA